jgi:hypothetical protein
MTDLGLIQFRARFLDFAPVLSDESTVAPLEVTVVEIAYIRWPDSSLHFVALIMTGGEIGGLPYAAGLGGGLYIFSMRDGKIAVFGL